MKYLIIILIIFLSSCTEIEVKPKNKYAGDPVSSQTAKEREITIK